MGRPIKDRTGHVYGRLTVLRLHIERTSTGKSIWECWCSCGNKKLVRGSDLHNGTSSCGCAVKPGQSHAGWKGYQEISGMAWSGIQVGAKSRGLIFELTIEQAWELFVAQDRKCALSGFDLSFSSTVKASDGTASLDRIDSSKGYTLDNVQWVHKRVNVMKMDLPDEEFVSWCKLIAQFSEDRKF